MPCIILTGYPCAGKSTLSEKIRERALTHSSRKIQNVVIINEQTACPDHSVAACYATAIAEKKTRGALKSAFDRAVAANALDSTLIILDSTNYIKGFRYELFCISKAAGSSHCVVWCLNDAVTVKAWNQERRLRTPNTDTYYSDELLEALILRYEPPDDRNRWDKPLYRMDLCPIQFRQKEIAGQVLDGSVYNMHNLSGAIGSGVESVPAVPDGPVSEEITVLKKSAHFKRATFKRGNKPMEKHGPSIKTGPLTAEALISLAELQSTPPVSCFPITPLQQRFVQATENEHLVSTTDIEIRSLNEQVDEFLEQFLLNVQPLQEGTSTRQHVAKDADVVHNVDSLTQQVCSCIVASQDKNATGTGRLPILFHGDTMFMEFRRRLTVAELRRIRKQYIQWVNTHPLDDASERSIAQSFLAYIETQK